MTLAHSHSTRVPSAHRGTTILEVLIAMMIMGLVMGSSVVSMGYGFTRIENARHATRISQILQTEMETLRSMSWEEVEALVLTEGKASKFTVHFEGDEDRIRDLVATRMIVDTKTNMKQITLTATWKDSKHTSHDLSYATWYGKEGLSDYYTRVF
ncbi:hypothetical protein JIN80_09880 [Cerasicoccus arenae]|nr:hypothetical protein [Cerasicoccus arenae]